MYDDDYENGDEDYGVGFKQKDQYHFQKNRFQMYGKTDVVGLKAFEVIKKRAYKDASIDELFINNLQKEAQNLETKYNFPYEVVDSISIEYLNTDYTLILNPLAFLLGWYIKNYRNSQLIDKILEGEKNIDMFTIQRYKLYIDYKILKNQLQYDTQTNKMDAYLKQIRDKYRRKQKYQKFKETLHDLLPEIFPRGYARFCLKAPTKTDDEKDFEFPKKSGFHFSCKDQKEGFVHIGLKNNTLSNSEKYPILPCCYQKPQDKIGGKMYNYENEDKVEFGKIKGTVDYQKLVGSKSIYSINDNMRYAYLPSNLKLLFSILDIKNNYVRMSVDKVPNSSLYCLLECFDKQKEEKEVISNLKKLINNDYGQVNKQEMLDVLDNKKFLDAKKFIPLYEEIFNCNIFMFCLNINEYPNGTVCTQYFNYKIFKELDNKPFIILFESYGSEMDNYSYPQYEIIVSSELNGDRIVPKTIKKIFTSKENIVKKLVEVYEQQFPISYEKLQFVTPIINQIKDGNHFVRILKFEKVNCLIDPINAFNVKIQNDNQKLLINNIDDVIEFLRTENLTNNFVYKINDKVLGIVSSKKINDRTLNIFFPVDNIKESNFLEYDLKIRNALCPSYLGNQKHSLLDTYRNYSKINRCMLSLLCYLYSSFKNKFIDISLDELYTECKELIQISDNFHDIKLQRNLNLENKFYINNKLQIPNEKYGIKLVYSLYLKLKNNHKEVINFKNNKFIPNYYEDINDFTVSSDFCILNNVSLMLFNNYKPNDYTLYSSLQLDKPMFYLQNEYIEDGNIVLVRRYIFDENYDRKIYIYEGRDNIKIINHVENEPIIIANIEDEIIYFQIKNLI
jgi:hypothetical protein